MAKSLYPNEATKIQRKAVEELFEFPVDAATVSVKNKPFELIVFDTETSGLKPEVDRVVQISGIKYTVENGNFTEIDRLDMFINQPEYDENKVIPDPVFEKENGRSKTFLDLTGISNEFLSKQPTEAEAFEKIYAFFGDNPIVCGHNVPFDYGFLTDMYIRNGKNFLTIPERRLDTLVLARDLISKEDAPKKIGEDGKEKPTYTLGKLAEMFAIDYAEGAEEDPAEDAAQIVFHNSMNDVIVTGRLFKVLINLYAERILEEASATAAAASIVKERAKVKSITFWEGYRGFSRIYVNAILRGNAAGYYYDVRKKQWGEKEEGLIVATDMDALIQDAYELAKVDNEADFAKVKDTINADADFLKRYA